MSTTVSEPQHMKPPCPNGFRYVVKSGDTMFLIAKRFGIPLDELIAANPQISDPNLIYPRQRICVPLPHVKHRRHCFMMHPTKHAPGAMGMGMMDMDKREVMVMAMDIPDPCQYGMETVALMARFRDEDDFQTVEMSPAGNFRIVRMAATGMQSDDPIFLIAPIRLRPFAFGPIFLVATFPLFI